MSNRTLVEFNHDLWPRIADDPESFAADILEMLRAGGSPRVVENLEDYGVRYVAQRHHSDSCSVVYKHFKVEL